MRLIFKAKLHSGFAPDKTSLDLKAGASVKVVAIGDSITPKNQRVVVTQAVWILAVFISKASRLTNTRALASAGDANSNTHDSVDRVLCNTRVEL
jgi:hypothetical protein